ncbi:hypothetical protein ACIL82_09910 [Enterococcus faecium]
MSTTIEVNKQSVKQFLETGKIKNSLFQNINVLMPGLTSKSKYYLMI